MQNHAEPLWNYLKKSVWDPKHAKLDEKSDFGHVRTYCWLNILRNIQREIYGKYLGHIYIWEFPINPCFAPYLKKERVTLEKKLKKTQGCNRGKSNFAGYAEVTEHTWITHFILQPCATPIVAVWSGDIRQCMDFSRRENQSYFWFFFIIKLV